MTYDLPAIIGAIAACTTLMLVNDLRASARESRRQITRLAERVSRIEGKLGVVVPSEESAS